jgi:hypothetical protein
MVKLGVKPKVPSDRKSTKTIKETASKSKKIGKNKAPPTPQGSPLFAARNSKNRKIQFSIEWWQNEGSTTSRSGDISFQSFWKKSKKKESYLT